MRLARTLLSYIFVVGILCAALIGGAMWGITPGAAVSQEARVAPIPPRLAESIERRKPVPVREADPGPGVAQEARVAPIPPRLAESMERRRPWPVREAAPEPAKPAMKEAVVSLT